MLRKTSNKTSKKGYTNNYLTIVSDVPSMRKNGKLYYTCLCKCGNYTNVTFDKIKSGRIKSCGCYGKRTRTVKSIHMSRAREILRRCTDDRAINYHNYGGRNIKCLLGLTVKEISLSIELVPGYENGLELDRIDNNGDYTIEHPIHGNNIWVDEHGHECLGNLRWVTRAFNNLNKRTTVSLSNLAETYRPFRDIMKIIKSHDYEVNDFFFKFKHSETESRHICIAIHKDDISKFND